MASHRLTQFVGQAGDVFGTFLHAAGDVLHLLVGQESKRVITLHIVLHAGSQHLSETADNVRRTNSDPDNYF